MNLYKIELGGELANTFSEATLQDIRQAAKEMGYVMVPMEPTDAMIEKGNWASNFRLGPDAVYGVYKTLLQAAEAAE